MGSANRTRYETAREGPMVYSVLFAGTMAYFYSLFGPCPGSETCRNDRREAVSSNGQVPGSTLNSLVRDTGGGQFFVFDSDPLATTMNGVAEELRRQYVLGFVPASLDGQEHKITVELTDKKLKARHRPTYLAVPK